MTELIFWKGAGWYASQGGHSNGWSRGGTPIEVLTYFFGADRDQEPDTYHQGYGTPQWIDGRPQEDDKTFVEDD